MTFYYSVDWSVHRIKATQVVDGVRFYKFEWNGGFNDSWEPHTNLHNCRDLVWEFHSQNPKIPDYKWNPLTTKERGRVTHVIRLKYSFKRKLWRYFTYHNKLRIHKGLSIIPVEIVKMVEEYTLEYDTIIKDIYINRMNKVIGL